MEWYILLCWKSYKGWLVIHQRWSSGSSIDGWTGWLLRILLTLTSWSVYEKSTCPSSWLRRNISSLCLLDLGLILVIISHYSSKFRVCGRLSKIAILFSQSSPRLNVKLDSQSCNPIPFGMFDSQFGKALRSFFTKKFNYIWGEVVGWKKVNIYVGTFTHTDKKRERESGLKLIKGLQS